MKCSSNFFSVTSTAISSQRAKWIVSIPSTMDNRTKEVAFMFICFGHYPTVFLPYTSVQERKTVSEQKFFLQCGLRRFVSHVLRHLRFEFEDALTSNSYYMYTRKTFTRTHFFEFKFKIRLDSLISLTHSTFFL